MEIKSIFALMLLAFIVFSQIMPMVNAQENQDGDIEILGLELEKLIAIINTLLSLFLFFVSFIAYKRDKRKRLFYVSLAFLLFAIKSFLVSSEIFLPEIGWFDPISTILEFAVLLSFFYGVLKK